MSQNTVILTKNNPVVIDFAFPLSTNPKVTNNFAETGLDNFTELTIDIGNESYSTLSTASNLFKNGGFQLRLSIGAVTNLVEGNYSIEVNGFSAAYPDGYLLSGVQKPLLDDTKIL
jgi:hypothetical protein